MNHTNILFRLCLAATVLCLPAYALSLSGHIGPVRSDDAPVAKVDSTSITRAQFDQYYRSVRTMRGLLAPSREQAYEQLIDHILLRNYAAAKIAPVEQLDTLDHAVLDRFQEQILGAKFEALRVTDAEVQQYYSEHPDLYVENIEASFADVLVFPHASEDIPDASGIPTASDIRAAQSAMLAIHTTLDASPQADFDSVSRTYRNVIASHPHWITADPSDPCIYRAARSIKTVGRISPVFRSLSGYCITRLVGIRPWSDVDPSHVRSACLQFQRSKLIHDYVASLERTHHILVHSDKLPPDPFVTPVPGPAIVAKPPPGLLVEADEFSIGAAEFDTYYTKQIAWCDEFDTVPSPSNVLNRVVGKSLMLAEARKELLDYDAPVLYRQDEWTMDKLIRPDFRPSLYDVKWDDDTIRRFYESYPEIWTSYVAVPVSIGATEADVRQAEERVRTISQAAPLKRSTGVDAGWTDFGYMFSDEIGEDYYRAAVALRMPGSISPPVRLPHEVCVIKLIATRPWNETDQNRVEEIYRSHQRQQMETDFVKKLHVAARIELKSR